MRRNQLDPLSQRGRPLDIFELARSNATVAACLQAWKQGDLSWDQMLMNAVLLLAAQNDDLKEIRLTELRESPPEYRQPANLEEAFARHPNAGKVVDVAE